MDVILSKKAYKTLLSLDRTTKVRITNGINGIPNGDIKPLKGYSDGTMRLRIGKYRVVYTKDGNTIIVLDIGSRGDIYK